MLPRSIMIVDDELPVRRVLARMLGGPARTVRRSLGEGYVWRVGGDDFVAISEADEAPHAAQRLTCLFDEYAADFPSAKLPSFPALSIAIVPTARRRFASYGDIVEAASELKARLKAERGRSLSRFAFDPGAQS